MQGSLSRGLNGVSEQAAPAIDPDEQGEREGNGDKKGSFLKSDIEWDDDKTQFIWRNDLKLVMNLGDGLGLAKPKGCPTPATVAYTPLTLPTKRVA